MKQFGEKELREELVRVWGEYGGHVDLFDTITRSIITEKAKNIQLKEQVKVLRESLDIVVSCMALERVERFDILEKCKEALNQTKF